VNVTADTDEFRRRLACFVPDGHTRERLLALWAAAIALADEPAMSSAFHLAAGRGLDRASLYEIVLQSYLFLGFPRMLIAAEHLHRQYKEERPPASVEADFAAEAWFDRGTALCRLVYAENYNRLRERVEAMAPEIFRWMVLEGYGKVLSRPGLTIIERELAIIACLAIENRPAQLHSHVRGALNVGTAPGLVRAVVEDIGPAAGEGYQTARSICRRLRIEL